MAARSTVDRHKARQAIEESLARGVAVRVIAEQYGLAKSSVQRHKDRMVARMATAPNSGDTSADELLDRLRALQAEAEGVLAKAKRAGNYRDALGAIRESRAIVELLAKMHGELQVGTIVNITVSTQWIQLRADLMSALNPFPEARVAVLHALEPHEQSGA